MYDDNLYDEAFGPGHDVPAAWYEADVRSESYGFHTFDPREDDDRIARIVLSA
jgi:hypothetical protein